MQDDHLHDLSDAYRGHKLDFSEYRQLRSQYIDELTGYQKPEEDLSITDENEADMGHISTKETQKTATFLLMITLTSALLLLIYALYSTMPQ